MDSSTYPHHHLLQTLSLLPQLQTLQFGFRFPSPNSNIRRKVSLKWVITHVTLPNLRWFAFAGVSEYLEALLPHMTTPLLVTPTVHFFYQLSFPDRSLQQFMTTTEKLRFSIARFCFHDEWCSPRASTKSSPSPPSCARHTKPPRSTAPTFCVCNPSLTYMPLRRPTSRGTKRRRRVRATGRAYAPTQGGAFPRNG